MKRPAILVLALAGSCAFAAAEDAHVPSFLEGTAVYTKDKAFCPGSTETSEKEGTIQVNRAGVYGYEIGCTFLDMVPEKDPESGVIYGWQARAQCGDDSGITRPDQFTLMVNEDETQLTLQSQNEYVLGSMLATQVTDGDTDPFETASHLSGVLERCPNY